MSPGKVVLFSVPLALLAAGIAVLAELNYATGSSGLFLVMIARLAEVALLAVVGMFAALGSKLKGSVLMTAPDRTTAIQTVIKYGVLPGFVLGLVNYLFFFYDRYSPFVDDRIRSISTVYDALIVSLDTGLYEEVIYRLFLLSSMLFLLKHFYRTIQHIQPRLVSLLPQTMAVVLSSMLFGLAHNVTGFTAAFTGGILLSLIFLSSGVECAIAAHVAANLLFFSASYLL